MFLTPTSVCGGYILVGTTFVLHVHTSMLLTYVCTYVTCSVSSYVCTYVPDLCLTEVLCLVSKLEDVRINVHVVYTSYVCMN